MNYWSSVLASGGPSPIGSLIVCVGSILLAGKAFYDAYASKHREPPPPLPPDASEARKRLAQRFSAPNPLASNGLGFALLIFAGFWLMIYFMIS